MSSGASFYKADLHNHTPASTDYTDRNATPEQIVASAKARFLDIIAITDHNSAEWVDRVRSAAKPSGLAVFPGVEITTPLCHILAIFDLATPKTALDDLLSSVGIPSEKRGREDAVSEELELVLQKIAARGGIAVAAHANSDKGLLQEGSGQYRIKIYHREDLAALEFTQEQHVSKFTAGQVSNYGPRACLQGSDSHNPSEMGRRYTFLKMDGLSLRGIKQSLLDYEVRIRFVWNAPTHPTHPQIIHMQTDQGFFAGENFKFHPSLNCFVGGKGVGKSTVIEFLRYAFGDISSIGDIAEDTNGKISALLGEAGSIVVEYLDSDGETKTVHVEFDGTSSHRNILDSAGNPTELIARPVFFSQGELTRIASTPVAQMELLDRYLDLGNEQNEEEASRLALRPNAEKLQELANQENDLAEEVNKPSSGLVASRAAYAVLEKSLKDPIFTEFPKWESEERHVNGILSSLDSTADAFDAAIDALDLSDQFPAKLSTDSPNFELFEFLDETAPQITSKAESLKTEFRSEINQKKEDAEVILASWRAELESKRSEYDKKLESLGEEDVRRAQNRLRNLRTRVDNLENTEQKRKLLTSQISHFEKERTALLQTLSDSRNAKYEKRMKKVREWQTAFQDKIKLNVTPLSDRAEYLNALKALAKGSRLRDADLNAIADSVLPIGLVNACRISDSASLSSRTGVREDLCQKLFSTLQLKELADILDLEAIPLEDRLQIEYAVEPGRYKALRELSTGGKGTVILSLALVEGDAPLVIDQPEEPLDTLAIHDQIVRTLRKQKDTRQFIFTTHNPNVAVGGDAELSYVLEASADKGTVQSSGGVDHEATNRLLLHHLEGGIQAFDLRSKKYIR